MNDQILLDTGPLVALLDRSDEHHDWAVLAFESHEGVIASCEAVLTEALHLLRGLPEARSAIFKLLRDGSLVLPFELDRESAAVETIMEKYSDLPSSLADACLVRMAEQMQGATVMTTDRHFSVYRRRDRRVIPLLHPRW